MSKILSVFLFLVMTVHNGVGNNIFNPTNQVLQVVDTSSKWENRGIFSLSLAQAALINWAAGCETVLL